MLKTWSMKKPAWSTSFPVIEETHGFLSNWIWTINCNSCLARSYYFFNFYSLMHCTGGSGCLPGYAPHGMGWNFLQTPSEARRLRTKDGGGSFAQVSTKHAENRGDEHARNRFRKYLKKSVTREDDLSLAAWSHINCSWWLPSKNS